MGTRWAGAPGYPSATQGVLGRPRVPWKRWPEGRPHHRHEPEDTRGLTRLGVSHRSELVPRVGVRCLPPARKACRTFLSALDSAPLFPSVFHCFSAPPRLCLCAGSVAVAVFGEGRTRSFHSTGQRTCYKRPPKIGRIVQQDRLLSRSADKKGRFCFLFP